MHIYYELLLSNIYKINVWISENSKYRPYFKDYLGGWDKIYIPTYIFYANQILYWN